MCRCERREGALQLLAHGIHLRAVTGRVDGQHGMADATRGKRGDETVQRARVAGDDDGSRAVQRGDREQSATAGCDALTLGGIDRERGHPAASRHGLHDSPALERNPGRARQVEDSRRVRCGDLAVTVSDHCGRLHPPLAPEGGEPDLNRKERGLRNLRFFEARPVGSRRQFVEQAPRCVRTHHRIALRDRLGEDGLAIEEVASHAGPLRPLAGEHEHDGCRVARIPAARGQRTRGLAPRRGQQAGAKFVAGVAHDREAIVVMRRVSAC